MLRVNRQLPLGHRLVNKVNEFEAVEGLGLGTVHNG